MKYLSIICLFAIFSGTAVADEPAVELLDRRGRNRIVSLSSGKVTLSVPPEWSIVASSFTSLQDNFDSLDPTTRSEWSPSLSLGNLLRIERLPDDSGEQPPRSDLTLVVHPNRTAEAAAEKMYREFSEAFGMEILISPKIDSKTINAKKVHFFRLASGHTVEEHHFFQVGDDVYQFVTSEAMRCSLPSNEIRTLVSRIEVRADISGESLGGPKDRASDPDD